MSRIFEIITPEGLFHFSDSDLPLTMGTGKDVLIPLPGEEEATIWVADSRGYLFLQAAETGVTIFHNHEQLQGSAWIKSGDTTRVGQTQVSWFITGDRVEVTIRPVSTTPQPLPPEQPLTPPKERIHSLPKIDTPAQSPRRKRHLLPIFLLFSLLVLAAFFVLTARRVEIAVQPVPDSLSVAGFPPMIKMGQSFLSLNGTYTLQAEKSGYQTLSEEIVVAAGEKTVFSFVLQKLPGKVTIHSRPVQGARVFLDGALLGETPLNDADISSGNHLLRLEKKHFLPLEQQLSVTGEGKKQSIVLELQPDRAMVALSTDPAGASVCLGAQILGTTPFNVELKAGKVLLKIEKKGFAPAELELDIVPGEPLTPETIRLEPAPARITLQSNPAGAMVSINDVFFGKTPVTLSLPPDVPQDIHLQLAGYKPVTLSRKFNADTEEEIPVTLQPLYGTILLSTDPVDATLFIDGKRHGPATGRLRLPVRKHTLTVQADGFEAASKTVLPKEGISQQLEIRLQKKGAAVAEPARSPGQKESFIRLGPATVQMGAARREAGRRANEQQRTVQLSRPFFLAAGLVTNQEFRRFDAGHRSGTVGGLSLDGPGQPVVNVSWEEAARYCNWLSTQNDLPEFYRKQGNTMTAVSPANTGYRLTTEAEWAYAARMAGRQQPTRYPWAGKFPPAAVVGNFGDESARSIVPVVLRGYNDGFPVTAPVGSFAKNPGGFFDLGGNVSQWCHDWYTPYTGIGEQKLTTDPMGPTSGSHHVTRGSSWRDATITALRLSYRGYSKTAKDDIGFRVARYVE